MELQLKSQSLSQSQSQAETLTYEIVQFYKNSLYKTIHAGHECASAIIDICLYPYAWTFLLWGILSETVWGVTENIIAKIYDLLQVIPLAFKVWFWNLECGLTYWCAVKDIDAIAKTMNEKIYPDLKTILNTLGLIPFSKEECDGLGYFLEMYRDVIFGAGRLTLPDFVIYHPPENGAQPLPAKESEKNAIPPSDSNKNSSQNLPEKSESQSQE